MIQNIFITQEKVVGLFPLIIENPILFNYFDTVVLDIRGVDLLKQIALLHNKITDVRVVLLIVPYRNKFSVVDKQCLFFETLHSLLKFNLLHRQKVVLICVTYYFVVNIRVFKVSNKINLFIKNANTLF